MRGLAAGLGVMLVDEGGTDGEGGGGSACNSTKLQLVGVVDLCSLYDGANATMHGVNGHGGHTNRPQSVERRRTVESVP